MPEPVSQYPTPQTDALEAAIRNDGFVQLHVEVDCYRDLCCRLEQELAEARVLHAYANEQRKSACSSHMSAERELTATRALLAELYDEYADRRCQFGDSTLWDKHEDKSVIGSVEKALAPNQAP